MKSLTNIIQIDILFSSTYLSLLATTMLSFTSAPVAADCGLTSRVTCELKPDPKLRDEGHNPEGPEIFLAVSENMLPISQSLSCILDSTNANEARDGNANLFQGRGYSHVNNCAFDGPPKQVHLISANPVVLHLSTECTHRYLCAPMASNEDKMSIGGASNCTGSGSICFSLDLDDTLQQPGTGTQRFKTMGLCYEMADSALVTPPGVAYYLFFVLYIVLLVYISMKLLYSTSSSSQTDSDDEKGSLLSSIPPYSFLTLTLEGELKSMEANEKSFLIERTLEEQLKGIII